MDLMLLAHVLRLRGHLRAQERWTRADLENHQRARLDELLAFARSHSPFYRELHAGLEKAPLNALPVVTKPMLMDQFDHVVTDPRIRRAEIEAHLAATDGRPYLGRYWVTATSGSTGRPALFLFDRTEWAHVLASFTRGPDYAGLPTGLTHRTQTAIVSSTNPTHMSSRVGATLSSPFLPTLRLDAVAPLAQIVDRLNTFRPAMLVDPRDGFEAAALGERLRLGLVAQGALATPVLVEQVAAIPRTPNGKAPLIRALSR